MKNTVQRYDLFFDWQTILVKKSVELTLFNTLSVEIE